MKAITLYHQTGRLSTIMSTGLGSRQILAPAGPQRGRRAWAVAHAKQERILFSELRYDKALIGCGHPREVPALAEAGAGVHVLHPQPQNFDGALT
jgi:hypothetical protein